MDNKNTALRILQEVLNLTPLEILRFPTGYCHSVYYVKAESGEFVLRITNDKNKEYYLGSVHFLPKLKRLGIPVPDIINHGRFEDVFYALLSLIPGKDLGVVYSELNPLQKRNIAKELSVIQTKASALPPGELYGNGSFATWGEYLEGLLNRSRERIQKNKIFEPGLCDNIAIIMRRFNDYFRMIKPTAFLDDITTKNVLIHEGKLSGIVDVDEICYGDNLLVTGLTNMALLLAQSDTDYIDFWLDEAGADKLQRKVVAFYSLLFCADFMGEQGMRFDNGNVVEIDGEKVNLLKIIYTKLINSMP